MSTGSKINLVQENKISPGAYNHQALCCKLQSSQSGQLGHKSTLQYQEKQPHFQVLHYQLNKPIHHGSYRFIKINPLSRADLWKTLVACTFALSNSSRLLIHLVYVSLLDPPVTESIVMIISQPQGRNIVKFDNTAVEENKQQYLLIFRLFVFV